MGKYDDIINLPHHVSKKHPQMSLEARSAQFAPFAAVAGVEDDIMEAERVTEERIGISEDEREILNIKLNILIENTTKNPLILITYFIPDNKKSGGRYKAIKDNIKTVDEYKKEIVLENDTRIPICEIVDIRGEIFRNL